jgi:hypothetical protein
MLTESRTINVLGTDIRILFRDRKQDKSLEECDGYYDSSEDLIVVRIPETETMSLGNMENYQKKVLRHEIIHAFLYESGMSHCSGQAESWATNEEMVDWLAIQAPKICKVFREQKLV